MQVKWLDHHQLIPDPANPNEQDDATFNGLVASIEQEGWTSPVQAVLEEDTGRYRIVAGEHRWRAAKILDCQVPTVTLPAAQFDEDRRRWSMVKDNVLKGRINPEKFARLYEEMVQRYDAEVLQALLGFTSEDAFQKVYKGARDALPEALQKALDKQKDEIKTIDGLAAVLNGLFREFGESLESNMMTFTWAGKEVLWITADKKLWKQVQEYVEHAKDGHLNMTEVMHGVFDRAGRPSL